MPARIGPPRRRAVVPALIAAVVVSAACDRGTGNETTTPTTARSAATSTTVATGPPAVPGGPAELPVARTEVAGTRWNGEIVVAGGLMSDGGAAARVHRYDADRNRWETLPSLPVPLHHFGMTEFDGRLWVVGGYTNAPGKPWQAQSAARSLGSGEGQWRDEPSLGAARGAFGAAVAGDRLVVVGGESGGRALPRVDVLDRGAKAWKEGPDLFQPREHLAVASYQGRIWAVAGRVPLAGNLATTESWDPTTSEGWRREPDISYTRSGIGADEIAGRLCVAGGEEGAGTIASVECRDPGSGAWTQVSTLQIPRHGLAVVTLEGKLHVIGGGPQPGLSVSAAHEVLEP